MIFECKEVVVWTPVHQLNALARQVLNVELFCSSEAPRKVSWNALVSVALNFNRACATTILSKYEMFSLPMTGHDTCNSHPR